MDKQVVSKERVTEHGEVYTNPREVNAMLDLVKQETERIDSRFLEPACGTGNFLAEILTRKLRVVRSRYRKSQYDYEFYAIVALASIYGIDILEDNVTACRKRLLDLFDRHHDYLFREKCMRTAAYIVERNVVWGNALTLTTVAPPPQPIVFSEWGAVKVGQIKRRDFSFRELLSFAGTKEQPLFSEMGEDMFFPTPEKEYPPVHFLEIGESANERE